MDNLIIYIRKITQQKAVFYLSRLDIAVVE